MSATTEAGLVAGVDTHRDTHTAAICDVRGRVVSQLQVPATPQGYEELLAWAVTEAAGRRLAWAIESTRHYGLGLARHLAAASQQISEIDSTRHVGKRRTGKSDPIDAVRAARELLARPRPAQMRADGDREALRLLMTGRDNAVQSGKTARTVLTSVIVTAPAPLREELRHLPAERRARACAALACPAGADQLTRVMHQTLIRLGQRITALTQVADDLEAQITAIVEDMAPGLVAAEFGLGPLTAAQILRAGLRDAVRHSTGPGVLRPRRPPPPQPPRRPAAQPRIARHRRQPDAQPPGHPCLHPAPPGRRQNQPGNPPLHQALPRPPPLPHPEPRTPHQPLTDIGASDRFRFSSPAARSPSASAIVRWRSSVACR